MSFTSTATIQKYSEITMFAIFLYEILSSKVNCIFGINAGRVFKFVHCYDTGTKWFQYYPDHTPLVCIPKVIPQEDS